jgi:hypothetical protein
MSSALRTFAGLGHMAIGLEGAAGFAAMARADTGCEVWLQDFHRLELPAGRYGAYHDLEACPTPPSLVRPSPDVVAAWVAGWASSRGVGPAQPRCGGLHIEVGLSRAPAK